MVFRNVVCGIILLGTPAFAVIEYGDLPPSDLSTCFARVGEGWVRVSCPVGEIADGQTTPASRSWWGDYSGVGVNSSVVTSGSDARTTAPLVSQSLADPPSYAGQSFQGLSFETPAIRPLFETPDFPVIPESTSVANPLPDPLVDLRAHGAAMQYGVLFFVMNRIAEIHNARNSAANEIQQLNAEAILDIEKIKTFAEASIPCAGNLTDDLSCHASKLSALVSSWSAKEVRLERAVESELVQLNDLIGRHSNPGWPDEGIRINMSERRAKLENLRRIQAERRQEITSWKSNFGLALESVFYELANSYSRWDPRFGDSAGRLSDEMTQEVEQGPVHSDSIELRNYTQLAREMTIQATALARHHLGSADIVRRLRPDVVAVLSAKTTYADHLSKMADSAAQLGVVPTTVRLMADYARETAGSIASFLDGVGQGVYGSFVEISVVVTEVFQNPLRAARISQSIMDTLTSPDIIWSDLRSRFVGFEIVMATGSSFEKGYAFGKLFGDIVSSLPAGGGSADLARFALSSMSADLVLTQATTAIGQKVYASIGAHETLGPAVAAIRTEIQAVAGELAEAGVVGSEARRLLESARREGFSRIQFPRGAGAARGTVPQGYTRVSRWMSAEEAALWARDGATRIPPGVGTVAGDGGVRLYVMIPGGLRREAFGPIRVDFDVPVQMLGQGGHETWRQIVQPVANTPIYNVIIYHP